MLPHDQQINALRPSIGFARHLHYWLIGLAVVLLLLSIIFWHPVPLMFAIFFGVVWLSEQQAGPNIVAAIQAYDMSNPTSGEVTISIDTSGDSPSYHAWIHEPNHPEWTYEFIPQGWKPVAGTHTAQIWRNVGHLHPALAAVEGGILIPRYLPKRKE